MKNKKTARLELRLQPSEKERIMKETLDRVTANEARADGYEVPQQTIYEETNMTPKKKERNYER